MGPERLYLTHVQPDLLARLPARIAPGTGVISTSKAVLELPEVDPAKVILLDPAATQALEPSDGDRFEYLLFGGILGDDPPQDRTKELRKLGFATRHLGPVQMTTDTAVIVAKHVIEDQIPLNALEYVDRPEIKLGKKETVELPFRYLKKDGVPQLPKGLIDLLKKSNEMSLI